MECIECGAELGVDDAFCASCGAPARAVPAPQAGGRPSHAKRIIAAVSAVAVIAVAAGVGIVMFRDGSPPASSPADRPPSSGVEAAGGFPVRPFVGPSNRYPDGPALAMTPAGNLFGQFQFNGTTSIWDVPDGGGSVGQVSDSALLIEEPIEVTPTDTGVRAVISYPTSHSVDYVEYSDSTAEWTQSTTQVPRSCEVSLATLMPQGFLCPGNPGALVLPNGEVQKLPVPDGERGLLCAYGTHILHSSPEGGLQYLSDDAWVPITNSDDARCEPTLTPGQDVIISGLPHVLSADGSELVESTFPEELISGFDSAYYSRFATPGTSAISTPEGHLALCTSSDGSCQTVFVDNGDRLAGGSYAVRHTVASSLTGQGPFVVAREVSRESDLSSEETSWLTYATGVQLESDQATPLAGYQASYEAMKSDSPEGWIQAIAPTSLEAFPLFDVEFGSMPKGSECDEPQEDETTGLMYATCHDTPGTGYLMQLSPNGVDWQLETGYTDSG